MEGWWTLKGPKATKKVAVVGGNNLRANDKWINNVALHLVEHRAMEVIVTGTGGGSLIGEKAAYQIEMPNVLMSGQKLVDRADILFTLPGGSATRTYTKMFVDAKKPIVQIVGEG